MHVLGIGEILWDIFPDRELLGGAALNFCANVRRLGDSATLITAVGKDRRGELAREAMKDLGLATDLVQVVNGLPTGVAIVETHPNGEQHFKIQRPAAFDRISISPQTLAQITSLEVDWLYFGTLLQTEPEIEHATHAIVRHLPSARRFYDLNLRAAHWDLQLVQRLCRLASILKLNESEALTLSELSGNSLNDFSLETFCSKWARAYDIDVICVTLGASGCFIYDEGVSLSVPGYSVKVHDTVGSGDAFSAAFLHGYHLGWTTLQSAQFANALGALVASRPGATPPWTPQECWALTAMEPSPEASATH